MTTTLLVTELRAAAQLLRRAADALDLCTPVLWMPLPTPPAEGGDK